MTSRAEKMIGGLTDEALHDGIFGAADPVADARRQAAMIASAIKKCRLPATLGLPARYDADQGMYVGADPAQYTLTSFVIAYLRDEYEVIADAGPYFADGTRA